MVSIWFSRMYRDSHFIMARFELRNSVLGTRIFRNTEVFGRCDPFNQIIDQINEKMQDGRLKWIYDKGVDLEFTGGLNSSHFCMGSLKNQDQALL